MSVHARLLKEFEGFRILALNEKDFMQRMCDRMHEEIPRYNWLGFYLIDGNDPNVLVLGPYTGSFTGPNVRIPLDRGLCGAAATSGETVVVDDVSQDRRFLVSSDMVKSEIVVPMFVAGKLVGELNAESYFVGTFASQERVFIESCAALVCKYLEQSTKFGNQQR